MTESFSPKEPTPAVLSDEAIEWLVLLESGRATPADRSAYAAWQGRSPVHAAAAREATALWRGIGETDSARVFAGRESQRGESPPVARLGVMTRRAVLGGAVAASAAAVVAGLAPLGPLSGLLADYATRVGERRRIGLADGSAVDLNTASVLSVAFTDRMRRLELHAGEAMFEVARDAVRPFVVEAAGTEAQAIGTVFSVRRDDAVAVRVVEGEVAVRGAGTKEAGVRVVAGQQLAFAADGSRRGPEPFDVAAETAWRRGKLIFNRRPLGEVASELDRYRGGRIAIPDARLRRLEVTGVFDLSEPDAVLRTIGQTLPVTVVQLPYVALIY